MEGKDGGVKGIGMTICVENGDKVVIGPEKV